MVRFVLQEVAESPLQVYNRLRILTRDFLLSQVSTTMRAPRKTGGRMKPTTKCEGERPRVCRRLFADPEESMDEAAEGLRDNMFNKITEQINRHLDAACEKYNFDFRNEVPLEGNWTWERISPDGEITEMTPQKLPAPEPPKVEPPTAEPPTPLQPPSVPQ